MHPINVDEALINRWVEEFRSQLLNGAYSSTKKSVEFKREIKQTKPGAVTVRFTADAYVKMWTLVTEFNSEIGWHGLVNRIDKTTFEIYDILVYPQVVTAATVNTDQQKYQQWLMDPDEHPDEVFNAIRMQGHSHVNMAVSPSSTDLSNQDRTLEILNDDDYYIFLIWNKRNERSCRIYDMAENVVYDENDVNFEIADMDAFRVQAESMLERRVPAVAPVSSSVGTNSAGYWVGGVYVPNKQSGSAAAQQAKPQQPAQTAVQTATPAWQQKTSPPVNASQVNIISIEEADDDDDIPRGGLYEYYQQNSDSLKAYGNRSCLPYGYGSYDY